MQALVVQAKEWLAVALFIITKLAIARKDVNSAALANVFAKTFIDISFPRFLALLP